MAYDPMEFERNARARKLNYKGLYTPAEAIRSTRRVMGSRLSPTVPSLLNFDAPAPPPAEQRFFQQYGDPNKIRVKGGGFRPIAVPKVNAPSVSPNLMQRGGKMGTRLLSGAGMLLGGRSDGSELMVEVPLLVNELIDMARGSTAAERNQPGAQNNNSPQLSDQTLSADSGFDPRFARTIKASSREFATDVPGVDQEANRIAALGRLPTTTELSSSSPAPDGSGATGTQLSMRQPSPEEMLAFLGGRDSALGAQNLAMYGRAASDLIPGMGVKQADIPLSRMANDDDIEDMFYGGKTPGEIDRLQRGEALDEVVIDSDYELSPTEKGQKSTEDIKKMVRERNAFRKAAKPENQTEKTVERPQVDGKTDYMVPYRNAEMMRRGAFLDADNSLQGLKNREAMAGFITAGNKKYAITDEFLKSNDPADLGPELSGEDTAKLKAQELLNDKIKNVTVPPAVVDGPMNGAPQGVNATDGKITADKPKDEATFIENNALKPDFDSAAAYLDSDEQPQYWDTDMPADESIRGRKNPFDFASY